MVMISARQISGSRPRREAIQYFQQAANRANVWQQGTTRLIPLPRGCRLVASSDTASIQILALGSRGCTCSRGMSTMALSARILAILCRKS